MIKAICTGLLVLPCFAYSAGVFTTSPTEVGVDIKAGFAYISISPWEDKSTCSTHSQVRFELNSEEAQTALSIALAAKMAGKQIKMYFADNDCLGQAPRPSTIAVVD